jgi:Rrf2 family protein
MVSFGVGRATIPPGWCIRAPLVLEDRCAVKLSTRARYALRMMVMLSREASGGETISLGDISKRTVISRRYLEQLAIALKRHGLIRGVSGRRGGYQLALPPADITVGAVVEAAIGPVNIVDCVRQPHECLKAEICECRQVYQRINDGIREVLNSIHLDELAQTQRSAAPLRLLSEQDFGCPTRKN